MRGKRTEDPKFANIIFVTEEGADIDKFSIIDLLERGCDVLVLRGREKSISLDELATFDRSQKMAVNGAANKTAAARDLVHGFAMSEAPQRFSLTVI